MRAEPASDGDAALERASAAVGGVFKQALENTLPHLVERGAGRLRDEQNKLDRRPDESPKKKNTPPRRPPATPNGEVVLLHEQRNDATAALAADARARNEATKVLQGLRAEPASDGDAALERASAAVGGVFKQALENTLPHLVERARGDMAGIAIDLFASEDRLEARRQAGMLRDRLAEAIDINADTVARDPAQFDAVIARTAEAVENLGLSPPQAQAIMSFARNRLAEALVLGQPPRQGLMLLASGELADEFAPGVEEQLLAEVQANLEHEEREAQIEASVGRMREITDLSLAISRDEATHADIERLAAELGLSEPERARLTTGADRRLEARRQEATDIEVVDQALRSGTALNPDDPNHQRAVDQHFRRTAQVWGEDATDARNALIAEYVRQVGMVPSDVADSVRDAQGTEDEPTADDLVTRVADSDPIAADRLVAAAAEGAARAQQDSVAGGLPDEIAQEPGTADASHVVDTRTLPTLPQRLVVRTGPPAAPFSTALDAPTKTRDLIDQAVSRVGSGQPESQETTGVVDTGTLSTLPHRLVVRTGPPAAPFSAALDAPTRTRDLIGGTDEVQKPSILARALDVTRLSATQENIGLAAQQATTPVLAGYPEWLGQPFLEPLPNGEWLINSFEGRDGKIHEFDGSKHVVLRDPGTGRLLVLPRSEKTNEDPRVGLGRLGLEGGVIPVSPTLPPRLTRPPGPPSRNDPELGGELPPSA